MQFRGTIRACNLGFAFYTREQSCGLQNPGVKEVNYITVSHRAAVQE